MMNIIRKAHLTNLKIISNDKFLFVPSILKRNYSSETEPEKKQSKGLVLGIYENENSQEPKFTPAAKLFDEQNGGKLKELVHTFHITGLVGRGRLFSNLSNEYKQVALIGIGKENLGYNELEVIEEGMENVRLAAAVGARKLQKLGSTDIYIDPMECAEEAATGASLAVFRYQDNKKKINRKFIPSVKMYGQGDADDWTRGIFKAEAQNLARKLSDAPANQMTPTCFAQAAVDALCPCGINVEVRTMDWIEMNNLNSFLTIARSSCEPPVFLEIAYCGAANDDKPILLVGKGLTFNSGGISLKRDDPEIDENRASMAGAACVVATLRAAAALSLPINITGLIPLCENMPSGMATKPGDVIHCLNGKTLSIDDTDKAAVVMLADTIIYGENTYKPKMVIDVATASYGVRRSLGGGAAGVFTNSNYLWEQIEKAGAISGDRVWRLPLWDYYGRRVKDCFCYDVSNLGRSTASACLAAAVLREFVSPCIDWMHIDIRGVGMYSKYGTLPYLLQGQMTGRPTRTLIELFYQLACPQATEGGH